jgi:hypothetical protein
MMRAASCVENKATVIICFNVPTQELATLQLSAKHVAFVDEFKYLGNDQQQHERSWKDGPSATLSQTTNDAMLRRVEGPPLPALHYAACA